MLHLDQDLIKDFDLYGEKELWEIGDLYGECNLQSGDDFYFVKTLKKKSKNGSSINHSVGTTTWMGEDSSKAIIYSPFLAVQPLGFKKRLWYKGGVSQQVSRSGDKGRGGDRGGFGGRGRGRRDQNGGWNNGDCAKDTSFSWNKEANNGEGWKSDDEVK
ncbi:hypothetical protein QQP08_004820 [Theobroma cacao]|nr:hypothetical protein QQP08_004820 [Theobroma cacao]